MHYYDYPWMDGSNSVWGLIMMLFWLAFLIVAAVIVVRMLKSNAPGPQHRDPTDIAKERYARGEISKKEFEQLKEDLK